MLIIYYKYIFSQLSFEALNNQELMSDITTNQEEKKESNNNSRGEQVANPALWFVHLTAVTVQIIFGIGS